MDFGYRCTVEQKGLYTKTHGFSSPVSLTGTCTSPMLCARGGVSVKRTVIPHAKGELHP